MAQAVRIAGVDVGKKSDPSALMMIEGDVATPRRMIVGCDRLPLRMLYTQQADVIANFCGKSDLVVIDGTGVGEAVVDIVRDRCPELPVWSVMITGGKKVSIQFEHMAANAPKASMVAHLVNCIEKGVLGHEVHDSRQKGVLDVLWGEMAHFARRGEKIEAAFGKHDDLVMALALALFGFAIKQAEAKRVV